MARKKIVPAGMLVGADKLSAGLVKIGVGLAGGRLDWVPSESKNRISSDILVETLDIRVFGQERQAGDTSYIGRYDGRLPTALGL